MAVNPVINPAREQRTISPLSAAELLGMTSREFILIAGKDGAGKSCAIVSMAWFVQNVLDPNATFFVIDTENKFPTALKSFGSTAPTNIQYMKAETMNDATDAMDYMMGKRKKGDWLAVESMGRLWERAQDMGYGAVSGYSKATYLEKRMEMIVANKRDSNAPKPAVVIPSPDQFWNVVKGAHDGAFLDLLSQASSLNVILSTTVSKPPKPGAFIKENETRQAARIEFGLDAGLDGAPRLPTYVETTMLLDVVNGQVKCRILRDNMSMKDVTRVEFGVENRKAWAMNFWTNCRG